MLHVIIGPPSSGKTTYSKVLKDQLNAKFLIHTDDYVHHGYVQALYVLIGDLKTISATYPGETIIVEGVQCYRLIRKMIETKELKVDKVHILPLNLIYREQKEDAGDIKNFEKMVKSLNSVFEDIKDLWEENPLECPEVYYVTADGKV